MKSAISLARLIALCLCSAELSTAVYAQQTTSPNTAAEYEDLAAAARLAQSNHALTAAGERGATLEQKRAAVSDADMVHALDLLRSWLDGPAVPPPAPDPDAAGIGHMVPGLLTLARFIAVRNYVLLANGRVSEAIEGVRDGLRLSYAIGNSSVLAWQSGYVIEEMLIDSLMPHLDRFSAVDCDRLLRLAREWTDSYDTLPAALDLTRRAAVMRIRRAANPNSVKDIIQEMSESTDGAEMAAQMQGLSAQAIQQTMESSGMAVDAAYGSVLLELSTPYWQRQQAADRVRAAAKPVDPMVQQIVNMAMPHISKTLNRYTQVQATARLIGCHAAIRRYRWEHDAMPPSLAELKLGDMAIDPFTGKQFVYKPEGSNYTITAKAPTGLGLAG